MVEFLPITIWRLRRTDAWRITIPASDHCDGERFRTAGHGSVGRQLGDSTPEQYSRQMGTILGRRVKIAVRTRRIQ